MSRIHSLFPVLLAFSAACGGAEKKAQSPPPALSSGDSGVKAVSPSLGVSDEIARECELRFDDVGKAPKFDFDASELHPRDRDALEQIGKCLTTGPLKGRSVKLVGRADPRGTTDYNMALGARRANGVATYLKHLGVEADRMQETSRGELDAVGTDEASWQADRRVDIVLADRTADRVATGN
jgi:peptidoglycan-associated lipoprotein